MIEFDRERDEARERFNEVTIYLNYISSLEPSPPATVPIHVDIMKGLFYVHLYAAFEKSVNDVVQTCLAIVSSSSVKNKDYAAPILTVALMDQLKSIRDSGHRKLPQKGALLFMEASAGIATGLDETTFAIQLQNAWISTLEEVFVCLGCGDLGIDSRGKATVNEVVGRRNAIAHGRESAKDVGERFRAPDLRAKSQVVYEVLIRVIEHVEVYCSDKKYIKPRSRRYYV